MGIDFQNITNLNDLESHLIQNAIDSFIDGTSDHESFIYQTFKGYYCYQAEQQQVKIVLSDTNLLEVPDASYTKVKDCENDPVLNSLGCESAIEKVILFKIKVSEKLVRLFKATNKHNALEKTAELILRMPKTFSQRLPEVFGELIESKNIEPVDDEPSDNIVVRTRLILVKTNILGLKEIISQYYKEAVEISENFHDPDIKDKPEKT